MDTELLHF